MTCGRNFSTPKTRRLHLIQAHGYPKEYFFAVTNKGVGGLLKKWGEGASLLRKPWKPRENGSAEVEGEDEDEGEDGRDTEDGDAMDAEGTHTDTHSAEGPTGTEDDDDEDQILMEKMQIERPSEQASGVRQDQERKPRKAKGRDKDKLKASAKAAEDVEGLTSALDSLSLVPASIQFGRGAKRGALQRGSGRERGRVRARGGSAGKAQGASVDGTTTHASGDEGIPMDVDHASTRGRGIVLRGTRGIIPIPRGGVIRGPLKSRGRGAPRGDVLGAGAGRGMGPGRGIGKDIVKA